MRILLVAPHIKIPGTSEGSIHHYEFAKAMKKINPVFLLVKCEKDRKINGIEYYSSADFKLLPKRLLNSFFFSLPKAIEICKRKK